MNNGVGTYTAYYFPPPTVMNNIAYYDTPYFTYFHTIFPEPFRPNHFESESISSYDADEIPEPKKVKSSCFSCFSKKKCNC